MSNDERDHLQPGGGQDGPLSGAPGGAPGGDEGQSAAGDTVHAPSLGSGAERRVAAAMRAGDEEAAIAAMHGGKHGPAGRVARFFVDSKLTPLLMMAAVLLGLLAIWTMPREEEPQIRVPFVDVMTPLPGAASAVVERRVTAPIEQMMRDIPGVDHIYSTSMPGESLVTVRFKVGLPVQPSLTEVYTKLYANRGDLPAGSGPPLVKLRSIYDVPVLALTLSGPAYNDAQLRELAVELRRVLKRVPDVSQVTITGGARREFRVVLDNSRMAAYGIAPGQLAARIAAASGRTPAGQLVGGGRATAVYAGRWIRSARELGQVVVAVRQGMPMLLSQVARIEDGPGEPHDYAGILYGPGQRDVAAAARGRARAAVTLAVAKRQGANAITVVDAALARLRAERGRLIPAGVRVTVTRDYARSAEARSNELLEHMALATVSVILLVALFLGWREAGVVGVAIPVTLLGTMFLFALYGYTLNRITLFALIFSIGILVDDAIVVVENIVRHYRLFPNRGRPAARVLIEAVAEVGNPTILATFAVIAALLPMAFVGGLMGPYMRPIPLGASAAMLLSLAIAFVGTPWAAMRLLHKPGHRQHAAAAARESRLGAAYRRGMAWLLTGRRRRWGLVAGLAALLLAALSLLYFKLVIVKMLPYDNKTELEVVLHMPETTPLETTEAVAQRLANYLARQPQVKNVEFYAGAAGPYSFNGLVRHYFLRDQPNQGDVQVNLVSTGRRNAESHALALRWRPRLAAIAQAAGGRITVAEPPPGPPVLQTLVAEVYGPTAAARRAAARQVRQVMRTTPGVVDVNWSQPRGEVYDLIPRPRKAALSGVSLPDLRASIALAEGGMEAGWAHTRRDRERIPIWLQWPAAERQGPQALRMLPVPAANGAGGGTLAPLGELTRLVRRPIGQPIFHQDLRPVDYVMGDVAGGTESPGYAIFQMDRRLEKLRTALGPRLRVRLISAPSNLRRDAVRWGGEWHTTVHVFRDLGIAFAAVLLLIYVLVVGWFRDYGVPLVILSLVPLTLIGILPGHALMGAFFTATSMIGFIAGAGIVVRNSIILVDFIELRRAQGMGLKEAAIDAGAVRFRPILLTAAAVVVGASVIITDPIFQGLAISLMAGEIASTLIAPVAVPVLYTLLRERQQRRAARKLARPAAA